MKAGGLRRRAVRYKVIAALALGTLIVLPPVAATRARGQPSPQPIELTVQELNVEYGGFHVSFDATVRVIRKAGADVVALEEAQGRTALLARRTGMPYFSRRLQILSRYPLIDPPGGDGRYLFVQVGPGQVVAIQNVHLPSNPYGPFWAQHGRTRREVLDLERRLRLPAIRPTLAAAREVIAQGIPVVLTGDFNSPSWRDWTERTVGTRPQIRFPVRWPVSLAVERAGFRDAWRQVHPNPLRFPGITWPAARPDIPGWDPGPNAPADRIDLMYAAGDIRATSAVTIGERGVPGIDLTVSPWPTDHRSVAITFRVTPGTEPPLVAVEQPLVTIGHDLDVVFHTSGAPGQRVAVVPAGGDPIVEGIAQQPAGPGPDGTLAFPTGGMAAGAYEAVLVDGTTELARIPFWLKQAGAGPEISTGMDTYTEGEPIDVSWSNARGERWDWIGVYRRHADPRVAYYLTWVYTGATVAGSATLDRSANGPWPLAPGRYTVYLLRDDGYHALASADFRVVEP
ncbi:MAG: endonuclease/exonuclease/phosphatase family protein [Candidatus Velamenicoccus archaeovorus]